MHTKEEKIKIYETLPADLKEAIISAELSDLVYEISKDNSLMLDQATELSDEVSLFILGLTKPKDLTHNLSNRLNVGIRVAEKISNELNTKVFSTIKHSLQKMHESASENHEVPVPEQTTYKLKVEQVPVVETKVKLVPDSPVVTPTPVVAPPISTPYTSPIQTPPPTIPRPAYASIPTPPPPPQRIETVPTPPVLTPKVEEIPPIPPVSTPTQPQKPKLAEVPTYTPPANGTISAIEKVGGFTIEKNSESFLTRYNEEGKIDKEKVMKGIEEEHPVPQMDHLLTAHTEETPKVEERPIQKPPQAASNMVDPYREPI